jgi:CO/xanthine dehydrogenase FAD-binding subunit
MEGGMEYLRPKTIDETLELLTEGIPLAGGTQLTADRYALEKVIDLQGLGLDEVGEQDGVIQLGAMTRLQQLMTAEIPLPGALLEACRHEAAWNIRNQATLGGALMSADGRSPLMTVMVALDPEIKLAPGDVTVSFGELMERRKNDSRDFLILDITFKIPECLAYDFVARAPMDLPLVAAAAALVEHDKKNVVQVGLGGYGEQPKYWAVSINDGKRNALLTDVVGMASKLYQSAGDAFASADYRSEIAGILSQRVVSEVLEAC